MSKAKAARTEASPDEESSESMSTTTPTRPDESEEDSFTPLLVRLESAIHRLKLATDGLSVLTEKMPAGEPGSAAFVVAETTEHLNQLYRDLNFWDKTHRYTPRDMQPLMEHLRQIGADDDARNRMLRGRTVLSSSCHPRATN